MHAHSQQQVVTQLVSTKVKKGVMHIVDLFKRRLSTKSKRSSSEMKRPLQRKLTANEINEAELALKRVAAEKKRLENLLNTSTENHIGITRSISVESNNNITRENIRMPRFTPKQAFMLHRVFEHQECEQLMAEIENNAEEMSKASNMYTCTTHSEALAQRLWPALENEVPQTLMGNTLLGISERCTLYKQSKGYSRKPGMDEAYEPVEGREKSFLSVYIYLNDDFNGGNTSFLKNWSPSAQDVQVPIKKGSVFVHQHNLLHEVLPITSGTKNVIRLDVMYSTVKKDVLADLD